MDSMEQKQQAVLTVAKAFYDRGAYTQYDQRSMDRLIQVTPRRRKYLPPEAGNSQYTHFLDCSGYMSAIYLTAFGYELPSDLTWIMVDQMEPRKYLYNLTHEETFGDIQRVKDEMYAILQPGDLITWQRYTGSGHIVMYLGEGRYTECTTPPKMKNSYNYEECKNQLYERGLWWRDTLDVKFPLTQEAWESNKGLFHENIKRFSIHRPLEIVGDILPQAKLRMGRAKYLWCAVENSAPGLRQAYPGGKVDYTVIVRNQNDDAREIAMTFAAPAGTTFAGEGKAEFTLQAGEEKRMIFSVTVDKANTAIQLEGPVVTVNDLIIYAHPVLLGRQMTDSHWKTVKETALEELSRGETAIAAAAKAYGLLGISMDPVQKHYSWGKFCYHDTPAGDVISRRPQKPFEDLAVYTGFGGKNVITPEMAAGSYVRTTFISAADLLPGDVILCLEDSFGDVAYSAFFDGEKLIGCFEEGGKTRSISGEEMDTFIDSLFGRFAFLLLRPAQGL